VIGACNDVCIGQWKKEEPSEKDGEDGEDERIIKNIFDGVM